MRIIIKILRKNGVNYTSRISNTQAVIRALNKMHIFCLMFTLKQKVTAIPPMPSSRTRITMRYHAPHSSHSFCNENFNRKPKLLLLYFLFFICAALLRNRRLPHRFAGASACARHGRCRPSRIRRGRLLTHDRPAHPIACARRCSSRHADRRAQARRVHVLHNESHHPVPRRVREDPRSEPALRPASRGERTPHLGSSVRDRATPTQVAFVSEHGLV